MTAIQKAIEDIKGYKNFNKVIDVDFVVALLNTYVEKEKQQIIDAFWNGDINGYKSGVVRNNSSSDISPEQYYNEKFAKGSEKQYLSQKNTSQTEISDEEIEKAAYKYAEVYQCPTEIKMCKHDVVSAWNKAIQWYREQLKSRQ